MIIVRSLIHASLHDSFLFHRFILHYTFSALVTVYTFSLKALSHLNVTEPELIFKYQRQWKEGVRFFVVVFCKYLFTFFVLDMIYSSNFDLPIIMLFYSEQNVNNS